MTLTKLTNLSLRTFEFLHHTKGITDCRFYLSNQKEYYYTRYKIGHSHTTPRIVKAVSDHAVSFFTSNHTLCAFTEKLEKPLFLID